MIVPLLIRIICNGASAERSIILPANNSHGPRSNNVCEKEALVKRSSADERVSNERYDGALNSKATILDDPERENTKSLAQKLAKEALKTPQLQRTIKKLTDLSKPPYGRSNVMRPTARTKTASKGPVEGLKRLNKLNNKAMRKSKRSRKGLKRIRNRHKLQRRKERPLVQKRNHYIKVGKIYFSAHY